MTRTNTHTHITRPICKYAKKIFYVTIVLGGIIDESSLLTYISYGDILTLRGTRPLNIRRNFRQTDSIWTYGLDSKNSTVSSLHDGRATLFSFCLFMFSDNPNSYRSFMDLTHSSHTFDRDSQKFVTHVRPKDSCNQNKLLHLTILWLQTVEIHLQYFLIYVCEVYISNM